MLLTHSYWKCNGFCVFFFEQYSCTAVELTPLSGVLQLQVLISPKPRGTLLHPRLLWKDHGEGDVKRLTDGGENMMSRFNWQ